MAMDVNAPLSFASAARLLETIVFARMLYRMWVVSKRRIRRQRT